MLLINVSLIMKCFIGELLLRKVTAFFPFPFPHLSGWSCMWGSSLLPSLLCSCWGFGQGYTFSDSAQFDFQFSVPHPLILWAKSSFWNRTLWHETCFFFSILYLPMLSTNSLPHYNSYKSAWGGICQHCCSGTVYLNSHSLSGALVKNSVLFSSYWGCHKWDLTIYSLLFCYLLLIFFQLLWTQLLASLHLLKQSWKKFLTWELL